ncbi:cytochrome P450 [Mycolicibacterium smegmatis]|uniref:Steroid C26-monooxygenase n=4 Tax=Mycolicibacterium smegmatis TaxID=1772 RepID=A0R146_MYCS2|nr:cytochrome P450 [Mycolicibacterium smegmatis]ABK73667.1 putative cytochrome P450 126 [Mycolicibacterium smegmatis MC2 155]AFP40957.1 Cytochrome P450 124 cyp124 [Mycolicibacterium smegmatis MC2 155]AIU09681.1 cytochrome P450 [Mycolicibacterium smegmatis MC2 155]AIU16306.1 cytochrome P450 [Mycolicibacterium smegmatis]AIU22929.1 cytochrome P450 [Mycolicibacterium smegmatis]
MTVLPITRPYDAVDLSSRAFWATTAADREVAFAQLRAERPVSWHPPVEDALMHDPDDKGFWAVTRHADIVAISRDSETFLSGQGVLFENVPQELLEASQSFLAMDAPRHTLIRKLVHSAFTPRQVARIEDSIKANAAAIVAELKAAGSGVDFVDHCAKELPIRTLSDMVGIPEGEREKVAHAADALVSWADPIYLAGRHPLEVLLENQMYLHQVANTLAAERRENPGNDLISALVHAEVDGDRLTDAEVAAFFVLLAVAGNDTTRQTTSHALKALTDFEDQRAWLMEDFDDRIGVAVEEMVRWASPVMTFRRTAAVDVELGGRQIAAGEKVVMFYASGNWDTTVFDRPDVLDLGRKPNPHLGFGGGGRHFCLGAHVARTQLRAIFGELLHQLPDIRAGEPEYLQGNFVHAIRAMPCTFS